MKEFELKYGCNPNQKPAKIFMENAEWIILPAAAEKVCKEIKERKNEHI